MTSSTPHYTIGSTITYATFGGEHRTVVVIAKEENIKNGEAGFDGTLVSATNAEGNDGDTFNQVWGYDRQIVSVDRLATEGA